MKSIPKSDSNLNIQQIAREAGVSTATVSRVFNGSPNVKPDTRQRVLDVMKSLNYHPNQVARSLRKSRTDALGLVIPNTSLDLFTDPFLMIIARAACHEAQSQGFTVSLWLGTGTDDEIVYNRFVERGAVDGILLVAPQDDSKLTAALVDSKVPCVVVGPPRELKCSTVDVDSRNAARRAAQYLIQVGYQRPATITGVMSMIAARDRYMGYQDALRKANMPLREELVAEGFFSESGGYEAMQQLLPHQPDAVFCANDRMAQGAIQAIRDAGLSVPHDIGVIGFDDSPIATQMAPALTTIRQPIEMMGEMSVNILLKMIENRDEPPEQVTLPTKLIIRESCRLPDEQTNSIPD